jgi:putative flavoprotein involved in K+ transport
MQHPEYIETIVVGGGQAGLAVGYHLSREKLAFAILDANTRVGDVWRSRWDSLRLFSPARFNGLEGMPYPAPAHTFITKDEMADYLERYAAHFQLPVRSGMRVERLWREGDRFRISAGGRCFEADNVVVAMANYQEPRTPAFAGQLDASITQLHSSEYRNPSQLQPGGVLVVGAGNSGAEISVEVVKSHPTWISGGDPGAIPFRIEGLASRLFLSRLVIGGVFHSGAHR